MATSETEAEVFCDYLNVTVPEGHGEDVQDALSPVLVDAGARLLRNDTERLELRKYCPRCRVHQPHRETR